MKTGLTISTVAHLAVLAWAVVTFVTKPLNAQTDSVTVDVITADQFSKLTAGQKDAKKAERPAPFVEKIGETKPVEDSKVKVSEKKEVVATTDKETPPPPEKIEKKEKKAPEQKADPIAEAIKKDEQKKPQEEKKAETKPTPPTPPKKPIPVPPKFNPMEIAALLNKEDARRNVATGATLNSNVSLGVKGAQEKALSQNELDALRARLAQLWNPPMTANPQELIVTFRIQLNRDGTLSAPPEFVPSGGRSQMSLVARDNAARALFRGQPYTMLRPENYDLWKDIEITFDPRQMFSG